MRSCGSMAHFMFFGVLLITFNKYAFSNELVVNTTSGQVEGINITTVNGHSVNGFLGVPYAEPPLGNLRFKPPVKISRSNETIKANERSKACLQVPRVLFLEAFNEDWVPENGTTSEDCLFLNVWVSSPKPQNASVMVWIHGGGYEAGTANSLSFDGQVLASKGVIVVSMNYRLSVFGFLMVDKEEAPGNVGLMDQAMALKWVQDNIEQFGGSPQKVTLWGESAGAASVGHHLLIPSSRGLFQRAILESGAATSIWSHTTKKGGSYVGTKFVEAIQCNLTTTRESVECLRNKSSDDLIATAKSIKYESNRLLAFTPVADGEYYPDDPETLISQRNFSKDIDILLGVQQDDGFFLTASVQIDPLTGDSYVSEETFKKYISQYLSPKSEVLLDLTKFQYTDFESEKNISNWRRNLADFASDLFFKCSMNTLADNAIANGNKVYFYQFNHKPSTSKMPSWVSAIHSEELSFIFDGHINSKDFTSEEVKLSEKMVSYWTEFVKKGDPNSNITNKLSWPLYTADDKMVLSINLEEGIQRGIRLRHCAFLNSILPRLLEANVNPKQEQ